MQECEKCLVSNGNRTEWSTIQGVVGRVISNWPSASGIIAYEHDYPLIVRHEVRLPINCVNNKVRKTSMSVAAGAIVIDKVIKTNFAAMQECEKCLVSNGNRTEWRTIQGVVGRVISNGPSAIAPKLYDTKSDYQLIVSITKCEKLEN